MNKCIYKGVDIFNPIAGKLKYFVDAFTKVYGERYREVIEKRLKNANYYFLGGRFSTIILKYQQLENEEIKKLEQTPGITPSLVKIKKNDIHERYQFIIKIFQDTQKQMDLTSIKYSDAVNDLIIKQINAVRKKNKLPAFTKLEAQKYASSYLDLLTISKPDFSKRKILLSDRRKKDFTELFQAVGFNEKNFESYTKNKNLLNSMFSNSLINQINSLNSYKLDELNKINFCVAELKHQLNKLNIYGDKKQFEDIGFEYIQNKTSNSAFVVNCVTADSQFKTLCFCKNALDLNIEDLTHEMGHIIDAFVVESNQDGFYYKSGFELHYNGYSYEAIKNSEVPEFGSKNYRHNELFNEMVNEFITSKVVAELKKTGKTFTFSSRENGGKIKYEFGFEVFGKFLEKHQDKLIELKMKVDKTESAYEYFGEENFKKLTALAKEYIEKRTALNSLCIQGNREAYAQIEQYKAETIAEFDELEQKIDKHIYKNEIRKNLENQKVLEKPSQEEKQTPSEDNKKSYSRPKFRINLDNFINKKIKKKNNRRNSNHEKNTTTKKEENLSLEK